MSKNDSPTDGDAQAENPLLELSADEQQELVDMIQDDGDVSRRSVLGGLAASGLAGALGFGGYQAATQPAQAATNDQVGSSTNLVDVYGAAVQANSVSTDQAGITNVAGVGHLSGDQTVPSGNVTQIQLDSSSIDHSTVVDVQTADDHIEVKQPGTYLVSASISFVGSANWSAGDNIQARIHVNGSFRTNVIAQHEGVNGVTTLSHSKIFALSAGDTIDMRAFHDSGSDEQVEANNDQTWLAVGRLG